MVINWSKPLEKEMSMYKGLIRGVERLGMWRHLSSSSLHLWGRSQLAYIQQGPYSCFHSCFPGRDTKCTGWWTGEADAERGPMRWEVLLWSWAWFSLTLKGTLYTPILGLGEGQHNAEFLHAWQSWRGIHVWERKQTWTWWGTALFAFKTYCQWWLLIGTCQNIFF